MSYCEKTMKSPLIVDRNDSKWLLLEQIINATTARRARQEMTKRGITPVRNAGTILRITILAIFFSVEITYVVEEMRKRTELRALAHVELVPTADEVYRFISRIDEKDFIAMTNVLIRCQSRPPGRRKNKTIIVDGSPITLDMNVCKKRLGKKELETKDYQWGFAHTEGYYPGFKLTLAIEYPSLVPLAFLIHPGSPHDSRIFTEILDELKRRRIIRTGDLVLFDRGYYLYDNYAAGVREYRIVPLIVPGKKFDIGKVMRKMNYPLNLFSNHAYRKGQLIYKKLVRKLMKYLERWDRFVPVRSLIGDVFKLAKEAFSLRHLHRYSAASVKKFVAVNVLLIGMTILSGVNKKGHSKDGRVAISGGGYQLYNASLPARSGSPRLLLAGSRSIAPMQAITASRTYCGV